jgi:NAD(P)H-dependent flavin oxidoreductase YrpB (nitropropane dioxygenase family)
VGTADHFFALLRNRSWESFSLISQVADAIEVPVIAAGGIADGRSLVAAVAPGAEAVQFGTAFLPCAGSDTNKNDYKEH